jgi:raffinose/stachyose/melibiose transport system substrate-binding protein
VLKRATICFVVFSLLLGMSFGAYAQDIKLTLWHIHTNAGAAQYTIQDAIRRFEADHPNVKIEEVQIINDEYKTKLMIAMGANDEPDIFMSWGGGPLEAYINAGKVWDMTDALKAEGIYDNFLPVALALGSVGDRVYGVPITNMATALVFYRTDIFERLNLEIPTTYSELLEVCEVLNKNNISPFTLANANKWTGSMYFMYLVDRIGGPDAFYKAMMRVDGGSFASEAFVKAGEYLQDLVKRNAFPRGFQSMDEDLAQSRNLLYTDRAAMYLMGSWAWGTIKAENEPLLEKLDFFVFPAIEGGLGDPTNLVGTPGDNYFSVAEKCENKEYAVKFLRYLSDENAAQMLIDNGSIPPFGEDIESKIVDPMMKKLYQAVSGSDSVQLWYDQSLPPELAQVHLDTTQALFSLEMTPEEAAQTMEQAAKRYHGEL